jgi:hypothetical protein
MLLGFRDKGHVVEGFCSSWIGVLIGDCNLDGDKHRFILIKNSVALSVIKSSLMPFAHKSNPKTPTAKMGVDRNLGPFGN